MGTHYYTRIPNGGVDRIGAPHVTSPDAFYDLLQFRPLVGRLEQFAPIISKLSLSTLASETASTVRYIDIARTAAAALRYLVVNEQTARYVTTDLVTQTLVPAITQIKVPNNTTVYGQALLYGYNSTDFAAINDDFEVEIQTTTTFRWRKNGGAWTSGVTIGRDVPLGGNGLKVDFLETTGYTVGDLWQWERTETLPYSASIASTKNFAYSPAPYNTDVYLGGIGRNIMRVRDGFITSTGYKRVYGKHVVVFQNHLVVSQFVEGTYHAVSGVQDNFVAATTPFKLGWSDLNNPDAFFSTSVNEAGTYNIPYNTYPEQVNYGITGLGKLQQTLWIYTADGISSMDYVGLPNVMQILPRFNVGNIYHNGLVTTPTGHYFIGRTNFYFFDGVQPRAIGNEVYEKFFGEVLPLDPSDNDSESVFGYYDQFRGEVSWIYWTSSGQGKMIVYSEKFGRWTFRNLPYETSNKPRVCGRVYNSTSRSLFGGVGKVNFEYVSGESLSDILLDNQASGGYTQPLVETNDLFYRDLYTQKETDSFFLDASWSSGTTGVVMTHAIRALISTAVAFVTGGTWTGVTTTTMLSAPRKAGRVFRFRFVFTGSKPVGCVLNGWGDIVEGENGGRQR